MLLISACVSTNQSNIAGKWKSSSGNTVRAITFEEGGIGSVVVLDKECKICRESNITWKVSGNRIVTKEHIPDEIAEIWIVHKFQMQTKGEDLVLIGNIHDKSVKEK